MMTERERVLLNAVHQMGAIVADMAALMAPEMDAPQDVPMPEADEPPLAVEPPSGERKYIGSKHVKAPDAPAV